MPAPRTAGRNLLLALCSAVLLSVGWLGVSGLPLLAALIPLLFISRSYGPSRRDFWKTAGWTALTITLWSVITVWWVWNAAPIGVFAATIVQVVLFGSVFMLYHYVSKRARTALAYVILVAGWIAAEHVYINGEISFPWLVLGNGFAGDPWAVQWYEYTGALGGSLWVLVSNLLVFEALVSRRRIVWLREAAWVAVPLLLSAGLYLWRPIQSDGKATVTIVQPDIDPYAEKFELPQRTQDSLMLALAAESPSGVDYIVLPETALDDNLWEDKFDSSETLARFRNFLETERPGAQFIAGATTFRAYPPGTGHTSTARNAGGGMWYDVYNSALAIDTASIAVHHKSKLVIGVEMIPYMDILEPLAAFIVDLGGTTGQLGTDGFHRVFRHSGSPQGDMLSSAPICYESVYGEHFAKFARGGAQIMFVITNDGWWGDTPGYRQHFSYSRLRAIETRRWIARSANTGISGFISPRGRELGTLGWDERGTITMDVPLSTETTFYAAYGDITGRIGRYVFLLSVLYYIVYRFRRRSHLTD